jgi:hypothetical protein
MKLEYILGVAVIGYLVYEYMNQQPSASMGTSNNSLTAVQVAYAAQILKDAGVQPTTKNVQAAATIASSNPTSAAYINAKASLVNQGGVL